MLLSLSVTLFYNIEKKGEEVKKRVIWSDLILLRKQGICERREESVKNKKLHKHYIAKCHIGDVIAVARGSFIRLLSC